MADVLIVVLCSNVAQHIPCICNVAGGRFGAQPRPMDRMVGICSQRHRVHRLYLHRPAILPRTHATNHTTLVRLHVTSWFGGGASRRGHNSKLANWPYGQRRACCVSSHLHQHYLHFLHRRVGSLATAAVLANAVPVLLLDLAWLCSLCISSRCRLDPAQPLSSPSAFASFGMPLFMQYVAAKLSLDQLARPGRLSNAGWRVGLLRSKAGLDPNFSLPPPGHTAGVSPRRISPSPACRYCRRRG